MGSVGGFVEEGEGFWGLWSFFGSKFAVFGVSIVDVVGVDAIIPGRVNGVEMID